jgi:PAB1-binding protein PBP1
MAMPLSIAKSLSRPKTKKGKVISEYAGKASPVSKKTRSGATNRRRKKGGS